MAAFETANVGCLSMSTTSQLRRHALSLLEVVLALSILAMSSVYLAQSMHTATLNAISAQRLTQAELVAESVTNQIIAGVLPAQPVSWTPYYSANPTAATTATQSQWLYQIQSVPTEIQGMVGLQIAVQEVPLDGTMRAGFDIYVNRWVIDPTLGLDVPPEPTEEESSETGSSGSSGSAASGSGSGGSSNSGGGAAAGGGPGAGGMGAGGFGGAGGGRGPGPGAGGGRGGAGQGPGGGRGGAGGGRGGAGGGGPGGGGGRGGAGGGFGGGGPGGGGPGGGAGGGFGGGGGPGGIRGGGS